MLDGLVVWLKGFLMRTSSTELGGIDVVLNITTPRFTIFHVEAPPSNELPTLTAMATNEWYG